MKSNKTILKPIIEVNEPLYKIDESKEQINKQEIEINKQEIEINTTVRQQESQVKENNKQILRGTTEEPNASDFCNKTEELMEININAVDYLIKVCNTADINIAKEAVSKMKDLEEKIKESYALLKPVCKDVFGTDDVYINFASEELCLFFDEQKQDLSAALCTMQGQEFVFGSDNVGMKTFLLMIGYATEIVRKVKEIADELETELANAIKKPIKAEESEIELANVVKKQSKSIVKQQNHALKLVKQNNSKSIPKFMKTINYRIFDIYMPNDSKFGTLSISPGNVNILFMNKKNKEVYLQFNEIKDPGKRLYLSQDVHIDELSKYDSYYNKNKHKCKCKCHKNNFKLLRDININCEGYNDYYESKNNKVKSKYENKEENKDKNEEENKEENKEDNNPEEITLTCIATGMYDFNRANNSNDTISGIPNIIKYNLIGSCGHLFDTEDNYFNNEIITNEESLNSLIKTNILEQLKSIKSCNKCKNNNTINTDNINIITKSLMNITKTVICSDDEEYDRTLDYDGEGDVYKMQIYCGICKKDVTSCISDIFDICPCVLDTNASCPAMYHCILYVNTNCPKCNIKLIMPEKYWNIEEENYTTLVS